MNLAIRIWGFALALASFSSLGLAAPDSRPTVLSELTIESGSGSFVMKGGQGFEEKNIRVFYHRPQNFSSLSPILIVLPGAGRNGDSYRDSWVAASERHGILVLSPTYLEKDYDMAAYQFCGLIKNLELRNVRIEGNGQIYRMKDEDVAFEINRTPSQWLFPDFDRLFEIAAAAVGSKQTGYDVFGHSAGGQILHRLAIFYPDSKAKRIVASNSGLYTLPDLDASFPFGGKDTALSKATLERSFRTKLVLFLGALDNENETRGIQTRTPKADEQGIGRLAKGKYFFAESRKIAAALNAEFNWTLEVVPDVGHDQAKMAEAAARFLYEK